MKTVETKEAELWKDIPGYEGLYQISDKGRVFGLTRTINCGEKQITIPGREKSVFVSKKGRYKCVMLYANGKTKRFQIHRLLYECFLGPIKTGMCIDHINNNPIDNRLENLQCITIRENSSKDTKAKKKGKLTGAFKEKRYDAYFAQIWINGKPERIGTYKTEFEAHQAYINKLNELKHI